LRITFQFNVVEQVVIGRFAAKDERVYEKQQSRKKEEL